MHPIPFMALLGAAALMTGNGAPGPVLSGVWGGPGANLTVDANGGRLEQECASGSFGAVKPDGDGRFRVAGQFDLHRPGPQRADEPTGAPAIFEGVLEGEMMRLTVRPAAGDPQSFTLLKGKRAKMVRCL